MKRGISIFWIYMLELVFTFIYNILLSLNILVKCKTLFTYTSKNILLIIGLMNTCKFLNDRLLCGH